MENPNCVLQLMKEIYADYTLDNVSKTTGCPRDILEESYELYSSTGAPEKAGNIMYAMGITQFTHGSQNVRATAVVQLLLGNMGIPGGGVNAQRGQSLMSYCFINLPSSSHQNICSSGFQGFPSLSAAQRL